MQHRRTKPATLEDTSSPPSPNSPTFFSRTHFLDRFTCPVATDGLDRRRRPQICESWIPAPYKQYREPGKKRRTYWIGSVSRCYTGETVFLCAMAVFMFYGGFSMRSCRIVGPAKWRNSRRPTVGRWRLQCVQVCRFVGECCVKLLLNTVRSSYIVWYDKAFKFFDIIITILRSFLAKRKLPELNLFVFIWKTCE